MAACSHWYRGLVWIPCMFEACVCCSLPVCQLVWYLHTGVPISLAQQFLGSQLEQARNSMCMLNQSWFWVNQNLHIPYTSGLVGIDLCIFHSDELGPLPIFWDGTLSLQHVDIINPTFPLLYVGCRRTDSDQYLHNWLMIVLHNYVPEQVFWMNGSLRKQEFWVFVCVFNWPLIDMVVCLSQHSQTNHTWIASLQLSLVPIGSPSDLQTAEGGWEPFRYYCSHVSDFLVHLAPPQSRSESQASLTGLLCWQSWWSPCTELISMILAYVN